MLHKLFVLSYALSFLTQAEALKVALPPSDSQEKSSNVGFARIEGGSKQTANMYADLDIYAQLETFDLDDLPNMDIYVINLNKRTDRCTCMRSQLDSLPFNVYRHSADNEGKCGLNSSHLGGNKGRKWKAADSLFCSNYEIWHRAMKRDAEYILVLEDDAILTRGFLSTLSRFVKGCSKKFNYVMITGHTYHDFKIRKDEDGVIISRMPNIPSNTCQEINLYHPTISYPSSASAGQLIRKDYLSKLITTAEQSDMRPMDLWWTRLYEKGGYDKSGVFTWSEDQSILAKFNELKGKIRLDDTKCPASMKKSNIVKGFARRIPGYSDLHRLECPPQN